MLVILFKLAQQQTQIKTEITKYKYTTQYNISFG